MFPINREYIKYLPSDGAFTVTKIQYLYSITFAQGKPLYKKLYGLESHPWDCKQKFPFQGKPSGHSIFTCGLSASRVNGLKYLLSLSFRNVLNLKIALLMNEANNRPARMQRIKPVSRAMDAYHYWIGRNTWSEDTTGGKGSISNNTSGIQHLEMIA